MKKIIISKNFDFGKAWYSVPCSEEYKNSVAPIFDKLEEKKENQRKSLVKELLSAIVKEIDSAKAKPKMAKKFAKSLIEKNDKAICGKSHIVYSFENPEVKLPGELIKVEMTEDAIDLYFDQGWQIQLKLCSDRHEVKFEIKYIGLPVNVYAVLCKAA